MASSFMRKCGAARVPIHQANDRAGKEGSENCYQTRMPGEGREGPPGAAWRTRPGSRQWCPEWHHPAPSRIERPARSNRTAPTPTNAAKIAQAASFSPTPPPLAEKNKVSSTIAEKSATEDAAIVV